MGQNLTKLETNIQKINLRKIQLDSYRDLLYYEFWWENGRVFTPNSELVKFR